MKKIKLVTVLVIASTVLSCTHSNKKSTKNRVIAYNEIKNAEWLIGQWQNQSTEGTASEIWEKKNDSTYMGKSYFIIGKDTVSSEKISLEQNGNQLFYIPTVKEQNGGEPVKFTLTSSTDKQLVFENPKHDFPNKISYTQLTKDSLLAEISGMIEGKPNSQQFPLTRVK